MDVIFPSFVSLKNHNYPPYTVSYFICFDREVLVATGRDLSLSCVVLASPCTTLVSRSACYTKMGEMALAMRDAEAAIEADPTFVKAHLRKGRVLTLTEQWGEAAKAYVVAVMAVNVMVVVMCLCLCLRVCVCVCACACLCLAGMVPTSCSNMYLGIPDTHAHVCCAHSAPLTLNFRVAALVSTHTDRYTEALKLDPHNYDARSGLEKAEKGVALLNKTAAARAEEAMQKKEIREIWEDMRWLLKEMTENPGQFLSIRLLLSSS